MTRALSWMYRLGVVCWLVPAAWVLPHAAILAAAAAILFATVTRSEDGSLSLTFGDSA